MMALERRSAGSARLAGRARTPARTRATRRGVCPTGSARGLGGGIVPRAASDDSQQCKPDREKAATLQHDHLQGTQDPRIRREVGERQ